MRKTFVIGDIHGCSDLLEELLEKITPLAKDDTVIFIGDYIDRGSDSRGVIDIVLKLRSEHTRVITLMGNHELMLLNAIKGYAEKEFLAMGGDATLKSYDIPPGSFKDLTAMLPDTHLSFFRELLPYWADEDHIYVHAGLQPGVHLTQQSPDWLFWSRDAFIHSTYDFGKKVIYGHTPYDKPKIEANKIGIDTGAVYGGTLTCLVLPENTFIAIDSKKIKL
ncbi:metallophosphoesterase family protein [Thermodesulfobacteriota bacterium]